MTRHTLPAIFSLAALALAAHLFAAPAAAQTATPAAPPTTREATASDTPQTASQNPAPATTESSAPKETTPAAAPAPAAQDDRLAFMADLDERSQGEQPGAAGLLVRTLGALLLIIGLLAAAAWGLRRFGGARFGAAKEGAPELTILSTIALGDKRSLAVVRFGEKTLLVGSTAQGITLLDADYPAAETTAPPAARSVADLLRDDEASGFDQELSDASRRIALDAEAWRGSGDLA